MKRLQSLSEASEGLVPDIFFEEPSTHSNLAETIDLADLSGVVPEFYFSPPQESNDELINHSEFCEWITSISASFSEDQESAADELSPLSAKLEQTGSHEAFRRNDSFVSTTSYGSSSSYDSIVNTTVDSVVPDTDIIGWIDDAERSRPPTVFHDETAAVPCAFHDENVAASCDDMKQVVPSVDLDDAPEVGSARYCRQQRMLALQRFKQKREQRNFQRKIKYECRKVIADCRPRVKGRFAKANGVRVTAQSAVEGRIDYSDLLEAVRVKEECDF